MNMEQMLVQLQMNAMRSLQGVSTKDSADADKFSDLLKTKSDASAQKQQTTGASDEGGAQQTSEVPQRGEVPQQDEMSEVQQQLAAAAMMQYAVLNVQVQQPEMQVEQTVPLTQEVQPVALQQTALPQQPQDESMVQTELVRQTQPFEQAAQAAQPEQIVPAEQTSDVPVAQVQTDDSAQMQQSEADVSAAQRQTAPAGKKQDTVEVEVLEQPVFQKVETVPVKVGEAVATVDTSVPDMESQLADQIQATLKLVGDKVEIQLKPENLGLITIELIQTGGKMGLVLHAESAKTTSLLAQHAGGLSAVLEDRTGQVVQVQVQRQDGQQPQYDGRGQQQQQQPRRQQQSKEEQDSFLGQLRLGLYQMEAI